MGLRSGPPPAHDIRMQLYDSQRPFGVRAPVLVLAVSICVALSACREGGSAPSGVFAVRDSAGIEIVENPAVGTWGPEEAWEYEEVLRLGGAEGPPETLFQSPGAIAPDGDGGVLVAERGENAVRRFASDGTFLGRLGGPGEGPGEFTGLRWIGASGETLLAYDAQQRRLTRFGRSGEVLETRTLEADWRTHATPAAFFPLEDGRILFVGSQGCSMPPPDDPRPAQMISFALPPEEGRPSLRVNGPVAHWLDRTMHGLYGESFCSVVPALAGHRVRLAVRADGVAAVAPGPEPEIHIFRVPDDEAAWEGGRGALPAPSRIVRLGIERAPVTPEEREAYRERHAPEDLTEPFARDRWDAIRAAWDTTTTPDRYPAIQELLWDDGGHLWALRGDGGDRRVWEVIDGEGRVLGTVEVPPGFEVRLVWGDRLWGIVRDAFDVPHLVALERDG